jgi:hypothetical protein
MTALFLDIVFSGDALPLALRRGRTARRPQSHESKPALASNR